LRPDQRAVHFRIVDGRIIAAAGIRDLVSRLTKQLAGGLLQAAGRYAQTQLIHHSIPANCHYSPLTTHYSPLTTHFFPYTCFGSKTRSPTTVSLSLSTRRKKQLL